MLLETETSTLHFVKLKVIQDAPLNRFFQIRQYEGLALFRRDNDITSIFFNRRDVIVNYPPAFRWWASVEHLTMIPSCFNEQSASLENLVLLPCPPQA